MVNITTKSTEYTEEKITAKARKKRKHEIRSSFFRVLRGKGSVFSVVNLF